MFSTLLVANRGEIAIRAFRAAYELGMSTVAVFPWEDRNSPHRQKADRSFEIGERGHPVRAYLSVDEIVATARRAGADAVYPGYGLLSENAALARACADAGITFVGPSADVLELTGNKARSVAAATEAGLPVCASTAPSDDVAELVRAAEPLQFPVFVKAVAGGGGRGMRRVDRPDDLAAAIDAAAREAQTAFGDSTVFLEEAVVDPRHIEVQVLADRHGHVIHLFERDCSVQRRHQKVIERAPAPRLDAATRDAMCADAVRFARHIGYENAGTVEFLLGADGRYVFIEMNPRIQVEHTVTEEITDVDLVAAQLRVAAGASLTDLGLDQENVVVHGTALQCRITTEDPANGFTPDTGRITAYRAPGGAGVRLDGGAHVGAEISPYFDSMLVKLTCRGRDTPTAVARMRRALAEFRIRGVSTNIGFLQNVVASDDFAHGTVTTSFVEQHPELTRTDRSADRATKILDYLAHVTVHRPHGSRPTSVYPRDKLPSCDPRLLASPPAGSRDRLRDLGPDAFARSLRDQKALGVTDTTFRDAHQSLLATRVRTSGMVAVARHVAALTPELLYVECWGGATFDVALRFLKEDPWDRLAQLRDAIPNVCLQMLLRGDNTVGYTPYPGAVTRAFVAEAAQTGIDVFRIFDALNDVSRMRTAIDAVRETSTAIAEVAMSYTGDLSNPSETLYTLDHYLRLADDIVSAGAHVLAVKDMAGLLRPAAARTLVTALRSRFDLPLHVHTHDTAGGQLATLLAAWSAGADAVDGASAPLAGTTSQPSLSAIVAATDNTERATGLDLAAVCDLEPYWEALRAVYAPFESGLPAPTGRVYTHEIPGGQLSNLRQQAIALGVGHRFEDIEHAYAAADRVLGRIVKVTPTSKVVGDLALALVARDVTAEQFARTPSLIDVPDSVRGFLRGDLGVPTAGWPQPLRDNIVGGSAAPEPPRELDASTLQTLASAGHTRREMVNELLFPGPARELRDHRRRFGDTSRLSANQFFYGLRPGEEHRVQIDEGVELLIELEAIGEPDARGVRTVLCTLNGQLRPVEVVDRTVADPSQGHVEKADPDDDRHVGAPFAGVVTPVVAPGDPIDAGQVVAVIEAMKMEASITADRGGIVERVCVDAHTDVGAGDLIAVVGPRP